MKWIFNTFLKDSNMRLNSTIITFVVAFSTVWLTVTTGNVGWEILVGLLGVAMGSKAVQKFAETKELKDIADSVNSKKEQASTQQQVPPQQPYFQYPQTYYGDQLQQPTTGTGGVNNMPPHNVIRNYPEQGPSI